jgi:Brp/Blh family beta-carotene 15,15'-monooxygenase
LLFFAVAVAAASLAPPSEPFVLVAIAIAIWHGAFDGVLARPLLEPRLGSRWAPAFVFAYLALAATVGLLWWSAPRAALPLFLLYSAWHFGTEADFGSFTPASAVAGLSMGTIPIAAACYWHPVQVTAIFATMLGGLSMQSFARAITQSAGLILWIAVPMAIVGSMSGVRSKAALVGLQLLLFWRCPPLLAFGVFFCAWHTPEHLFTSSVDARGRFSPVLMWSQLRSGLIPWLASLTALAAVVALGPKNLTSYASALFILLSALTVPHLMLNELRRRNSSASLTGARSLLPLPGTSLSNRKRTASTQSDRADPQARPALFP